MALPAPAAHCGAPRAASLISANAIPEVYMKPRKWRVIKANAWPMPGGVARILTTAPPLHHNQLIKELYP
jgi:hypothetical protein